MGDVRKKEILFVDDEANFLQGIRLMLREYRSEWNLSFAGSVDEATAKANENEYDAIVSDVSMPIKTGLDLLKEIRECAHNKNTPIIILTGNAEAELKRNALDLGATDLLNKPVGLEDLVARLRSVLRLKEYQILLESQNEELARRVRLRTMDLEESRRDIVWRLAKAGEFRDEETGDHVVRVACCSRLLATALELPEDVVETVFLTSPLHDIGKIGIPDSILLKSRGLTKEERAIMETHCEIGAAILMEEPKGMSAFTTLPTRPSDEQNSERDEIRQMASTIVMSHHEKWNGSGYPKGLSGEDIPQAGRIVAVTDVYDALRSERPYKRAFSTEETLETMSEGREVHFGPDEYDAFLSIVVEFESIRERFQSD